MAASTIGLMLAEHQYTVMKQFAEIAASRHDAQQALIDELMLEFCPDEMTEAQVARWEASQAALLKELDEGCDLLQPQVDP